MTKASPSSLLPQETQSMWRSPESLFFFPVTSGRIETDWDPQKAQNTPNTVIKCTLMIHPKTQGARAAAHCVGVILGHGYTSRAVWQGPWHGLLARFITALFRAVPTANKVLDVPGHKRTPTPAQPPLHTLTNGWTGRCSERPYSSDLLLCCRTERRAFTVYRIDSWKLESSNNKDEKGSYSTDQ